MHDKPVVMLDPFGHYTGLLTWLAELEDKGYVTAAALDRLLVVSDVDAALDACAPGR
jgi:predicted Rossmann-fold nucleotide-binding protein